MNCNSISYWHKGQMSLAAYRPWDRKELDTTEQLSQEWTLEEEDLAEQKIICIIIIAAGIYYEPGTEQRTLCEFCSDVSGSP